MLGMDNVYLKIGFALALIGVLGLFASPLLAGPALNLTLLSQAATLVLVSGAVVYFIGRIVQVRARRAQT